LLGRETKQYPPCGGTTLGGEKRNSNRPWRKQGFQLKSERGFKKAGAGENKEKANPDEWGIIKKAGT